MNSDKTSKFTKTSGSLTWILGLIGILTCVTVPWLFAENDPLFPLPGLYFIEISWIGVFCYTAATRENLPLLIRYAILWAGSGILLAFVILGAWTIGPGMVPAFLAFSGAALHIRYASKTPFRWSIVLLIAGFITQAALILLLAAST